MQTNYRVNKLDVGKDMRVMEFNELEVFLARQQRFILIAINAISAWTNGAADILKRGNTVQGMTVEELEEIMKSRGDLLNIPASYMIFTVTAAIDAYLRTVCVRRLGHEPMDDSWFSLSFVERVTGVRLEMLPHYHRAKKLYDARDILARMTFGIDYSLDEVVLLIEDAHKFAREFKEAFEALAA